MVMQAELEAKDLYVNMLEVLVRVLVIPLPLHHVGNEIALRPSHKSFLRPVALVWLGRRFLLVLLWCVG